MKTKKQTRKDDLHRLIQAWEGFKYRGRCADMDEATVPATLTLDTLEFLKQLQRSNIKGL